MQQPSDIVLYSLRLAKDSVSKVIITSSGMNAWTIHEYVSGKCGETPVYLPNTTSCQISPEHSVKPNANDWYTLL